jgi:leucine dehydrogenase
VTVFEEPNFDEHEHVSFFSEPAVGLRAIVAIHRSGPLGTSGGGCRMWPYASERAALRDVLRLSRAMTYKLALAELPAGGAKAVVIGRPAGDRREPLLLALGRAIDRLGGRFIAGEDVGITPDDLEVMARATPWVNRQPRPSAAATAYGVRVGMQAAVERRLGHAGLDGVTVALQGLGRVGLALGRSLAEAGARLVVTDLDARLTAEVARELGALAVEPDAIYDTLAQVFSPCALADALDGETAARLRCAVVAGSANNQLAEPRIADLLAARGILYAPDFVVNAGGVLAAAGLDESQLRARLDGIGALLVAVFARAERDRVSTHEAAEQMARARFADQGGRP